MANDQEVKYLVPGLERGLQLLLAFGEQHRELTFAELHRLVDMPKVFWSAMRAPIPSRWA